MHDILRTIDREKMLERCEEKSALILEVAKGKTWAKLWDRVMDLGSWQVKELKNFSRVLNSHGRGSKMCHGAMWGTWGAC